MCGISGVITVKPDVPEAELARRARSMADAIAYRGPDGSGLWTGEGAALAHRRLAIVDLTPSGAQPMASQDGRWVISYNGEIYNAEAVAKTMPELNRRGTSDTEIVVESVARRGLERTLADLNGMFAIAFWDRRERTLHLVRDRMGIKPLFYAHSKEGLCFASELKSFAAGGFEFELDGASVASFLRFGYVPAPHSIYRGVSKLLPGEVVSLTPGGELRREKYWSLEAAAKQGLQHPFAGSDADAVETLDELLRDAVSGHMISDVPLGAFLSGGIDSSTVVALMIAARRGPVRTFSIGFPDFGYDESPHAKAVAAHLGTVHEEMTVTAADALSVVPQLAEMYDEPFADSSQIPTFAVSKMTRARVTVALSGDGGDELFAGYNRYSLAAGPLAHLARVPSPLRRAAAAMLEAVPAAAAERVGRLLPKPMQAAHPADKLNKFAEVLKLDGSAIYLGLVSQNPDPDALMLGLNEYPIAMRSGVGEPGSLEWMQFFDADTYLPDDILQKVDRASMAVSLELQRIESKRVHLDFPEMSPFRRKAATEVPWG
jgi:asparagine synthase (glutamine-hydrolysing)